MKLSHILSTMAAVSLAIAPVAAEANTRASASTFGVGPAQFSTAKIGSRLSAPVGIRHGALGEDGDVDIATILLLLAAIIGGVCAAACGGGNKSPGAN